MTHKSKIFILIYHSIPNENNDFYKKNQTPRSIFEKQLKVLSKRFNVISLNAFISAINEHKDLPKNSVILTFDDGYKDNFTVAFDLLEKYNLPATFFLTTGYLDKKILPIADVLSYIYRDKKIVWLQDLIERLSQLPVSNSQEFLAKLIKKHSLKKKYFHDIMLDWDDVKAMQFNELITFGSHSVTHSLLYNLNRLELNYEVKKSKLLIEKFVKQKIYFFSCPYGGNAHFSKREISVLRKNGYHGAVLWVNGFNTIDSDPFTLKRIYPNDSLMKFAIKLRHYNIYENIKRIIK